MTKAFLEAFEAYEKRQAERGVVDGWRVNGVKLQMYPDGSGALTHHWVAVRETPEASILESIFTDEKIRNSDVEFETIEELFQILGVKNE